MNEKTDDAATHQQLMEEMAAQASKADDLTRTLIAKQSALGVLESKLEVTRYRLLHIAKCLENHLITRAFCNRRSIE